MFSSPFAHAQNFSFVKPSKREIERAVRDARTHLPKMERVLCLLAGNCRFPRPTASEDDLVKTGLRLRNQSLGDGSSMGITLDVPLISELRYISPAGSVRVRAFKGEIAELVFFRDPLSRRGVVVYGEKPSDQLTEPVELQAKWRFGFQK